ncbi:dystroglycan-like [Dorcoceras hygrometricum]|nr:dystroglycan-like [Dorcoceras hygrometricum]
MAASFYSNSIHVDFESALAIGEPGMVSMFQALIASGLQGFLGCPAVVYEEALVEFFANGTVRDGLVVSTVNWVAVEISEKLFAETFDLPVDGLEDISEMPKDKIFYARSIVSLTGEPVTLSGLKSQMKMHYRLLCDIKAKSISVKAGSFNAITVEKFSLLTAVVCDVKMNWGSVLFGILKKMVSPGTKQAKGFAIQISLVLESVPNLVLGESSEFPSSKILTDKTIHRYIAVIDKVVHKNLLMHPKTSKKKSTLKLVAVAQEAIPIQIVPAESEVEPMVEDQHAETKDAGDRAVAEEETPADRPAEEILVDSVNEEEMQDENVQSAEAKIDKDEDMSLDDLILSIPADIPLPSASIEITTIKMGTKIQIPGVDEKLPFSFKKLASINVEEMSQKEDLVLSWGETESIHEALSRKRYILLKYREMLVRKFLESWKKNFKPGEGTSATDLQVIDMLWERHLDVLQELSKQKLAHGLLWDRTCCSAIFEGSPRDRGAVIARTNTNTPSKCWIRTMIYVNGVWTVEPCADRWVKIPQQVISSEVRRQRQYDDTLPPVNIFYKTLTKRWAEICLEVVDFCASRSLLQVGSLHFCRSLSVIEPVLRVAPRQSPMFAFRVSQFCSVFVDFSLFSWLPTADITDLLSSIALDRTSFRDVQIAQERTILRNVQSSVSVAPSVQLTSAQRQSSSTFPDDSSMQFDEPDIATTVPTFSLPGSSTNSLDITKALNQLQASLDQISHRDDGAAYQDTILMHLRDIEKKFTARFDNQDRWIGALRNDSNDQRNLLSLEIKSSHRQLRTQIATATIDQIDMQREVKELNAKVDAIAMNLERVKRDAEATKEAILHQLFEFQSQAQANQNILHAQLSELVDYIHRGGADKKGESGSRGPQQPSNVQIGDSAVRPPTFAQRVDMAQRRIVETVLDADSNRESLERKAAAEREHLSIDKWYFSSWGIRWKSADGMQSVVGLFSEIFSRYIPCEQSVDKSAEAFFREISRSIISADVFVKRRVSRQLQFPLVPSIGFCDREEPAGALLDENQQVHYLMRTSRCIT